MPHVFLGEHDDATVKTDEVVSNRELMNITFSINMFTMQNKNKLTLDIDECEPAMNFH